MLKVFRLESTDNEFSPFKTSLFEARLIVMFVNLFNVITKEKVHKTSVCDSELNYLDMKESHRWIRLL